MKMVKVVHIITKLEMGGAQLNTIFTVEHLNNSLFEIHLISGPGGILTKEVREKSDNNGFSFSIVKNLVRKIDPIKDIRAFFELRKKLKKISPDIVHTHSSKAGMLGRIAASFIPEKPIRIHSVHGFPFSNNQKFIKRTFFSAIEKAVSFFTDHFIFVSEEDIRIAKEKIILKLGNDNYTLIRSGFDLGRFKKKRVDKNRIKEKYGIGRDRFVVGVIAPFKPQKGLFHLIEIAESVIRTEPDIIFFIAGDGGQRSDIEKILKEKGIYGNFRLPGFIKDIENVISIFDIGVSTALWEGLPQSLVQLRINEKAVVASDISGNREVIVDGKNGYLSDPNDHKIFAEKIIKLIRDKDLRESFSRFKQDFSEWDGDTMVLNQEKLYKKLAGGRK